MRFEIPEKLSALLFVSLLATAVPWDINAAILGLVLIFRQIVPALRPVTRISASRFRKGLTYFALAALIMVPVNGLLIREGGAFTIIHGITFYSTGLEFGLRTGTRLLVLATALLTFFGSTPIPALTDYLHGAGLPSSMAATFLLTLYFLDHLPGRINQIFTAQEARGAPVRAHILARTRSFFTILSPLILSSIVESIDRAMALELRGFRGDVVLSRNPALRVSRGWSFLSIIFLTLSCVIIAWIGSRWLLQ